ncbi:MAG: hypothetical protein GY862_34275 [Gammaproteobacteria bacterium]|nr:hypothetical protein [Gammaproteobacteria bacterium]
MKKIQLDQEEQELLEAFEAGEFQSELTPSRKGFIEQSAAQTFKKDKLNFRIFRVFRCFQKRQNRIFTI